MSSTQSGNSDHWAAWCFWPPRGFIRQTQPSTIWENHHIYGGFGFVMAVPQIVQIIGPFVYVDNHGDLGIPHDLRTSVVTDMSFYDALWRFNKGT